MAVASALGPTNKLVPVSRMASQPSTQDISVSTPTVILNWETCFRNHNKADSNLRKKIIKRNHNYADSNLKINWLLTKILISSQLSIQDRVPSFKSNSNSAFRKQKVLLSKQLNKCIWNFLRTSYVNFDCILLRKCKKYIFFILRWKVKRLNFSFIKTKCSPFLPL